VLALAWEAYAELVAVEGSVLTHLPDGLNLVDSAAIPLVALTGDQLMRLAARVWITLIDVKPVPFIASLTQLNDIATNKGRAEQKIPNKYKLRVLARHRGFHRAVAIDDNC
jgi:hypothetical protein